MKSRFYRSVVLAFACGCALLAAARADETTNTVKFSDPGKPGTVKISLGRGDLRIQGADTAEVTIKSDAKPVENKPRKDGLRVISAATGFSFSEKDNVVTVDAMSNEWGRGSSNLQLTVPRNTRLVVENAWGGDVSCAGVSGDLEINSMRGEIRLDDVAGGVVVSTMSGKIQANVRELHDGKPLSFTSMNGEVTLRVPDNTKANVRLRTQNGSVLTDFDETTLVTKAEAGPGFPGGKNMFMYKGPAGGKVISAEIEDALREASRVSATAARQALEAVKQGFETSKMESEEARQQLEAAKKDIERARREMDRSRRERDRNAETTEAAPTPPAPPARATRAVGGATAAAPKPPVPPKVPLPTLSGGKIVTGTLNGGGPEISVATMNGDVIVRKADGAK